MKKRAVKTIDMGASSEHWCIADHHAAYRSGHATPLVLKGLGCDGLPLGALLQCPPQQDAALLAAALSVERVLNRPI